MAPQGVDDALPAAGAARPHLLRGLGGAPLLIAPGVVALCLATLLVGGGALARPGVADGTEASTVAAGFARFENAWRDKSPAGVVDCIAERGRLRLRLFERPFKRDETYTMLADRATTSLEQYFEDVERLQLAERKPDDERQREPGHGAPGSTPTVRTYDYHYRVKGKSPSATRLQVRVTQTDRGGWVLESVLELPGRDEQDEDGR